LGLGVEWKILTRFQEWVSARFRPRASEAPPLPKSSTGPWSQLLQSEQQDLEPLLARLQDQEAKISELEDEVIQPDGHNLSWVPRGFLPDKTGWVRIRTGKRIMMRMRLRVMFHTRVLE